MSTQVELPSSLPHEQTGLLEKSPSTKRSTSINNNVTSHHSGLSTQQHPRDKTQEHPLHAYDLTTMAKFYEATVSKLKEQNPKWKPQEWTHVTPMPTTLTWEQKYEWPNPMVFSQKQHVYETFARFARDSGEPMILMPNFDYGDILNFERFLQALKSDGVNAIGKYKQYLNNKDMRKFEVDLVVVHPRYGVLLFEIKECDHLDNKRRSRARIQLSNARSCFESMGRLIIEAKGWTSAEAHVPIAEFVALPNVQERPFQQQYHQQQQQQLNNSTASSTASNSVTATTTMSSRAASRILSYLIKSDMETQVEFGKWWNKWVVEPRVAREQALEAESKTNKFDASLMNWMVGLINCIRHNSIMPVVYPESESDLITTTTTTHTTTTTTEVKTENKEDECKDHKDGKDQELNFQPALNVHGEFFPPQHESVRSLSRVCCSSKCAEKIRKTICLQTLWLLLNDSQKKISVVCSEMNKAYYEEFFSRQRKLYNNLNNIRFYADLHSCAPNPSGTHSTIKKDGEIWFFDASINGPLNDVMERVKELNAFWVFTTQEDQLPQYKEQLSTLNVKTVKLDQPLASSQQQQHHHTVKHQQQHHDDDVMTMSIKFPLRLQCDLLIIGDIVGVTQLKSLYRYLKSNTVANHANQYQSHPSHQYQQYQHQHHPQMQQLQFNPAKKFKTVKFIRGGTIDNLRTALKMHDSIQAQVVLMHVGDEDIFKTRNSGTTVERVKELATLVKEYCPKSFCILSTLMRRLSRTENSVINEVNKGITTFCKQTKETLNCFYMMNNHFEPDYHSQEGRLLNNKGLRLYVENVLFVCDYFLIKNNKQH